MPQQPEYFGRDLEAMARARNLPAWILSSFRRFLGSHIVEVGAGCGNFSPHLAETRPESLVCIEPSRNMYELLCERVASLGPARALHGTLREHSAALPHRPDTILYVNVLEHIEHDLEEIRTARDTLAPGGHLIIFVPALQWLFGSADDAFGHFRRYEREGLSRLITQAGLEPVSTRFFDIAGILPWFVLFRILRMECFTPSQVGLYDGLVVPVMRPIERVLPPPIGKNLVCIARKS
jgi:SAM-dependent methyltransferase